MDCRRHPLVTRKEEYRLQYTVERNFAWLGNYRRLPIRWERLFGVYRSFFAVALMLLGQSQSGRHDQQRR